MGKNIVIFVLSLILAGILANFKFFTTITNDPAHLPTPVSLFSWLTEPCGSSKNCYPGFDNQAVLYSPLLPVGCVNA